jgi:hypothetical protein
MYMYIAVDDGSEVEVGQGSPMVASGKRKYRRSGEDSDEPFADFEFLWLTKIFAREVLSY